MIFTHNLSFAAAVARSSGVSLTEVLAIIGAVTGVSGAILGVMSFLRDRGRLIISTRPDWEYHKDHQGNPEGLYLHLYLINAGRQPVPIIGAGVSTVWRFGRREVAFRVLPDLYPQYTERRLWFAHLRFLWGALPWVDPTAYMMKKLLAVQLVRADEPVLEQTLSGVALSASHDAPLVMKPGTLTRFVMQAVELENPVAEYEIGGEEKRTLLHGRYALYAYLFDALGRVVMKKIEHPGGLEKDWRCVARDVGDQAAGQGPRN